jgi:hypothetical protein
MSRHKLAMKVQQINIIVPVLRALKCDGAVRMRKIKAMTAAISRYGDQK